MGAVIPGAARLISETAQRVHTIGQKQKNAQHLRRVQALLSGRQAKGLTSGSLPTFPSVLICPLYSQHVPRFLSLPSVPMGQGPGAVHQNNRVPVP